MKFLAVSLIDKTVIETSVASQNLQKKNHKFLQNLNFHKYR